METRGNIWCYSYYDNIFLSLLFLEWTVRWKWYLSFQLVQNKVCTLRSFSWWTANKHTRLIRTSESFKTPCYLYMHLVCVVVISKTRWDIATILVVLTAGNINTRWSLCRLQSEVLQDVANCMLWNNEYNISVGLSLYDQG